MQKLVAIIRVRCTKVNFDAAKFRLDLFYDFYNPALLLAALRVDLYVP